MHTSYIKKSDRLGRYFTSERVGQLLIESMQNVSPSLVLDLGAGDGALTAAASKQWLNAHFMTVDIDLAAQSKLLHLQAKERFTHTTADALRHDLPNLLNLSLGSTDAAICNPPYLHPKWNNDFSSILKEAGLDDVMFSRKDVSAELIFIAQNLRFLKNSGVLGLILPDGIISGEKYIGLRRKLLDEHAVESIIELPRRIFRRTDAKTHILVLKKNGTSNDKLTLQKVDENCNFMRPLIISMTHAHERLDYSFHANFFHEKNGIQIRNVASKLIRGRTASSQRKFKPYPVFHTTDMKCGDLNIPQEFLLSKELCLPDEVIATEGDILLSRVGRNLSDKICIVRKGNVAVSDCIFVLRVRKEYRNKLLSYLLSNEGKTYLNALSHGVGAKFLTQNAILSLTF
ncbi:N-6 DNA methylase [Escherichia coli]|uniref:N-6 DNA methylase n=1 Tax=Escherichia coli TaxID=562 RepID=UPI00192BC47C|nr:N-6 DNA methylase [Escherichia coli]EKR5135218.1 N-6 DNA methylase [Escherichia coli]MBL4041761.1 N-6 DNA methylase [Escherichia coli]MBL4085547.1 N-6 DNA methylase [Escherichia coli]MCV5078650.1 N-6 DNA methylase [Escherichia coli]MCV5084321.1 N-6 DNA methylase [Escherichia coli]